MCTVASELALQVSFVHKLRFCPRLVHQEPTANPRVEHHLHVQDHVLLGSFVQWRPFPLRTFLVWILRPFVLKVLLLPNRFRQDKSGSTHLLPCPVCPVVIAIKDIEKLVYQAPTKKTVDNRRAFPVCKGLFNRFLKRRIV